MNLSEEKLNPVQLDAVQHKEGPLLVLAGAGSGKTRVVTARIAHLIDQGIDPSEIVAVTFTNKAAGEMQERIHRLLGARNHSHSPLVCTFHSLGARILRETISRIGYSINFTIYDEEDSSKLLKGCLQALENKKENKTVRYYISQAKNELLSPAEVHQLDLPPLLNKSLPGIYALYQERLKESNAVDFDDLLYITVRLFQDFPDILHAYQKRWTYLLIDEYQDTNKAQYLLARQIAGEKRNIFVVGDPDQSIYSWRGANIQNILNFEKDYPGARVLQLEQNYRSRKNILDAANALIQHNISRYEKNLWSDRGVGQKISLFIGGTEREEAGFVAFEIERLHLFHQVPLNEIAVFYRTNFQSRIFEDFLLRKRIPYVIVGGISFYQRKEIKDLLAFLRVVASDNDFISIERTINLPKRGIGETTLEKIRLRAVATATPLIAMLEKIITNEEKEVRLSSRQKEGVKEYLSVIKTLRTAQNEATLQALVIKAVNETKYLDILREDPETFEDRKGNVEELIAKAHEWELYNDSSSLTAFLEELSLKSAIDDAQFSKERINLMTIHNSKGLEFSTVFIVGLEEDLFPHANARDSFEALEEERRLCYVGMTRAKERLYLTATETRFIWGVHRIMNLSRFLREIPKEYIEKMR